MKPLCFVTLTLSCSLVAPARAEVVRVEVQERQSVLGGRSFGPAGPYEKLQGEIHFAFDPANLDQVGRHVLDGLLVLGGSRDSTGSSRSRIECG